MEENLCKKLNLAIGARFDFIETMMMMKPFWIIYVISWIWQLAQGQVKTTKLLANILRTLGGNTDNADDDDFEDDIYDY